MKVKTFRLLVLRVNDKRIHGNVGPAGTVYRIPQQGAAEFEAAIRQSRGKMPQARNGNRRVPGRKIRHSRIDFTLGEHPKPAIDDHLKTGQRES